MPAPSLLRALGQSLGFPRYLLLVHLGHIDAINTKGSGPHPALGLAWLTSEHEGSYLFDPMERCIIHLNYMQCLC